MTPSYLKFPFHKSAKYFNVSTDFLLGMEESATISVSGLTDKQISAVLNVIQCFKDNLK